MKNLSIFIVLLFFLNGFSQSIYQKYFDEYLLKGSTTIFDLKNNKWIFTDSLDAERKTLPASTFKIINSLIALETKAIDDENQIIKWDGTENTFFGSKIESWNKDTDLKNAYKNSAVWFYVELAKKIGRKKYKYYLKKCDYGNKNLSEKGIDFWNYGNFEISPLNQIDFLKKLYKEDLPFSKITMKKVKEIMISEKTENYIIRDKTGWTKKDGVDIGWYVGYLQTTDNIYFFATRLTKKIEDANPNFSKARKEITKAILDQIIPTKNKT